MKISYWQTGFPFYWDTQYTCIKTIQRWLVLMWFDFVLLLRGGFFLTIGVESYIVLDRRGAKGGGGQWGNAPPMIFALIFFLLVSSAVSHVHDDDTPTPLWKFRGIFCLKSEKNVSECYNINILGEKDACIHVYIFNFGYISQAGSGPRAAI